MPFSLRATISQEREMYCSLPWPGKFNQDDTLPRSQEQFAVPERKDDGWANN